MRYRALAPHWLDLCFSRKQVPEQSSSAAIYRAPVGDCVSPPFPETAEPRTVPRCVFIINKGADSASDL